MDFTVYANQYLTGLYFYLMHNVMRLRILSCLLLLVVFFDVVASNLYTTINLLRDGKGNCGNAKQLAPLKPLAALERVARDLARGNQLEQSLKAAGYMAARVNALTFRGNGIDSQLAGILAKKTTARSCRMPQ